MHNYEHSAFSSLLGNERIGIIYLFLNLYSTVHQDRMTSKEQKHMRCVLAEN